MAFATFYRAFSSIKQLPAIQKNFPEITIVGKSNVGKSSLINHCFGNKSLAKVSSCPGKTKTINFFLLNNNSYLIDLPGYGYAKMQKEEHKNICKIINEYLEKRASFILFLLDCRRIISNDDISLLEWISYYQIPFFLIFTKTDKLKKNELQKTTNKNLEIIKKIINYVPDQIYFSIKDSKSKDYLLRLIKEKIEKKRNE
jgi:GTP-binding protein